MRFLIISAFLFVSALHSYAETYVTHQRVSIDRCASAWFIKRFVDPDAQFIFFKQGETVPKGIGFGFFGAPFFNKGPDCTFTSLLKGHKKQSAALKQINDIANDVLAWTRGTNSMSARLSNHIADLGDLAKSDAAVFELIFPTFDLLYSKCGGTREMYLASERKHLDWLEFHVLERLLNDTGREKVATAIAGGQLGSISDQETVFQWLQASTKNEASGIREMVAVFNGESTTLGAKNVEWILTSSKPGVQDDCLQQLFSEPATNASIFAKCFDFEKMLWETSFKSNP